MTVATATRTKKPTWTREQIRAARRRPLKPLLEHLGYQLNPLGDGNYRVMQMPGDIVLKHGYRVTASCPGVAVRRRRKPKAKTEAEGEDGWRSIDNGDAGNGTF